MAIVGVDSLSAGIAANTVAVAREPVDTAADMAAVTTVGEEIGQIGVLVVHAVLGTAGTIAEHKVLQRLVALALAVAAREVGRYTLSLLGD